MKRTALSLGVVTALLAGLGALSLTRDGARPAAAQGLVPYDDCTALLAHHRQELRASATPYGLGGQGAVALADTGSASLAAGAAGGGTTGGSARAAAPVAAAPLSAAAGELSAVGRGGTGTNLQEQDVDEPDRAKLRDGRLVVLARERLTVLTASATPTVVASLPLPEQSYGGELLLVGDRALVVLQGSGPPRALDDVATSLPSQTRTRLVLVDLADPATPRVLEQAVYDGGYLSARLVDGTVRLVTSTSPQVVPAYPKGPGRGAEQAALRQNQQTADRLPLEAVLPEVVRRDGDGTVLQSGPAVRCDRVAHAVDGAGSSTLLVTTLRPQDGLAAVDSTGVTAHGDLVYASSDRLYVGTSRWGTTAPPHAGRLAVPAPQEVTTQLHAFDTTSRTRTRYVGSGTVAGYVLGRWALSEHEGALRVATTLQPPWESGETSSSSLVVLREQDGALVERGRVDGLGRTERIQAVRYVGDLAAVVTFRQTDPLYLVDLSDEARPAVRGELEVPGFSTYLHPLGDGLLLGLGQEATAQGRTTGMQVSVFDVRDLTAPVQVDRLQLGQGYSDALQESRAFGYDPATRLATLPFTTYGDGRSQRYGSYALGVHVDEDGGLREAGRMEVFGSPPDRVLSDGERVYAVNQTGVVAGDPRTMTRTGAADVPA